MNVLPRARFVATGSAALAATAARAATAQSETPVSLIAVPVDVSATAFYALDKGFFKQAGLAVDVTSLGNGAAILAALASGKVDFGSGSTTSVVLAREHGISIVIVAPAGMYTTAVRSHGLIVRADSPIRSARDLAGKTIGIAALKTIGEVAIDALLDKNAIDPASVKLIEVPYGSMVPAVVAGRIDAASIEDPFLGPALAQGLRSIGPVYDAIAPQWVVGAYFTTESYAKAHPDIVRKFAGSIAQAATWGNRNPVEAWKILDKYSGTTTPPGQPHVRYTERLRPEDFQPLIDASAKYGLLKASVSAKELFAPGLGSSA